MGLAPTGKHRLSRRTTGTQLDSPSRREAHDPSRRIGRRGRGPGPTGADRVAFRPADGRGPTGASPGRRQAGSASTTPARRLESNGSRRNQRHQTAFRNPEANRGSRSPSPWIGGSPPGVLETSRPGPIRRFGPVRCRRGLRPPTRSDPNRSDPIRSGDGAPSYKRPDRLRSGNGGPVRHKTRALDVAQRMHYPL